MDYMDDLPMSQTLGPGITASGQLSDEMRALQVASTIKQRQRQRPPVPLFNDDQTYGSQILSGQRESMPFSQSSYVDLNSQDFITPVDGSSQRDGCIGGGVRHARSPSAVDPNRLIKRARRVPLTGGSSQGVQSLSASPGPLKGDHMGTEGDSSQQQVIYGKGLSNMGIDKSAMGQRKCVRRVMSPPCCRSMFIETDAEAEDFADWRKSGPSVKDVSLLSMEKRMFKEVTFIGEGSFSKAFTVRHRIDGREYVIKRSRLPVLRTSSEFAQFVQECQVLAWLPPHPGVISYYGSWTDPVPNGGEVLYVQLEKCGLDLVQMQCLLGGVTFKEGVLIEIARQMASALDHLHSHGIAHLDVKPENIFLANNSEDCHSGQNASESNYSPFDPATGLLLPNARLVLGDFGSAVRLEAKSASTPASVREGDSRYISLELLNSDFSKLEKSDIFSLGAMMYELASGSDLPKDGQSYQDIRRGKVPLLPTATASFMRMIRLMLQEDPNKRPSASELLNMPPLKRKPASSDNIVPKSNEITQMEVMPLKENVNR